MKSIVIFSSTKHPKQAWEFARFLTSAKADLLLMTETSQLPMRRGLTDTEPFATYMREHPRIAYLASRLAYVRGTDDTVHLVEIFDTLSQLYESAVLYGLRSPEEAVARASKRVQRILDLWK